MSRVAATIMLINQMFEQHSALPNKKPDTKKLLSVRIAVCVLFEVAIAGAGFAQHPMIAIWV